MTHTHEYRMGIGFDVHKFCPPKSSNNNTIMLCGVEVAHPYSLEGHSDADVGLHACVDALLGAMALGDIGSHFPPNDPKWQGENSRVFLDHARHLLNEINATIVNIDVTIICETPKILPHREKMRETIAEILDIELYRVSVKATTTEKLGFTGRKEGIAAQAVASVRVTI